MSKSQNFSVYLLKEGFNAENALKEGHKMTLVEENNTKLPHGSVMFIVDNPPKNPWWKDYWGLSQNLLQSSVGAIVFLPVVDRWFALTFGSSYHYLKEASYEYDFGLKTTLNTLDPDKIKSTDILVPETAKRQRIQVSTASDLTFFDFNQDENIVKRLTGAVKDEFMELMKNTTGASSLRFATSREPEELVSLCQKLLDIYNREDYKTNFPGLLNITPVRDPFLIETLDYVLMEQFKENSKDLTLCIPEILDYMSNFCFRYKGAGARSIEFEDVYIINYREYLEEHEVEITEVSQFKRHYLLVCHEDGRTRSFPIYKCFLLDCNFNGKTYHLCEGSWYEINQDFISKISMELDPLFLDNHEFLMECNKKEEAKYNKAIETEFANMKEVICLDKTTISTIKNQNVEPCDVIAFNEDKAELIHNKISTRSSTLSHLFNQGYNSVVLLTQNKESKKLLKKLVGDNPNLQNKIDKDLYHVTYGIITNKPKELKSTALPIFSRISLLRTFRNLKLMRIDASVYLIKDNVDRKTSNNPKSDN